MPIEIELAEHAAVIRALGKRAVRDIIEIGQRLNECKIECDRNYGPGHWLELALASKSTPAEARDEVLDRATNGESQGSAIN
jgi:hypothetical protein